MQSHERVEQERILRKKVLAGDETAWRTLYDSAFAELWNFVCWRCAGMQDLAEEITQETWLIAVRRMSDFDPQQASFTTWLRGIAAHRFQSEFRCRKRRPEQPLPIAEWAESVGDDQKQLEQSELIARALAELPDRYEAVLRAKYLESASVDQIAAQWNETPKAVESLLTRARQAFRRAYEKCSGNDLLVQETEP